MHEALIPNFTLTGHATTVKPDSLNSFQPVVYTGGRKYFTSEVFHMLIFLYKWTLHKNIFQMFLIFECLLSMHYYAYTNILTLKIFPHYSIYHFWHKPRCNKIAKSKSWQRSTLFHQISWPSNALTDSMLSLRQWWCTRYSWLCTGILHSKRWKEMSCKNAMSQSRYNTSCLQLLVVVGGAWCLIVRHSFFKL